MSTRPGEKRGAAIAAKAKSQRWRELAALEHLLALLAPPVSPSQQLGHIRPLEGADQVEAWALVRLTLGRRAKQLRQRHTK